MLPLNDDRCVQQGLHYVFFAQYMLHSSVHQILVLANWQPASKGAFDLALLPCCSKPVFLVTAANLPALAAAAELEALLPAVCQADCTLCKGVSSGRLQVMSSGSGLPVVNLAQVRSRT